MNEFKDLGYTLVHKDKWPCCEFCRNGIWFKNASIDGKTKMGPWAYMCESCFKEYGVGLGLGKGQILKVNHE